MKKTIFLALFAFNFLTTQNVFSAEVSYEEKAASCRTYFKENLEWDSHPWTCNTKKVQTLSTALKHTRLYLPEDNPSFTTGINHPICKTLLKAGLGECNYSVRYDLAKFLSLHGVNLFPSTDNRWPGDTKYHGTGEQNTKLLKQVKTNAILFKDGDLTAEEVRNWKQ